MAEGIPTGVHAKEFEHLVHPHDAVIDDEVVHVDVSDSTHDAVIDEEVVHVDVSDSSDSGD